MAKNMQPYLKRCRTLGISPATMGVNKAVSYTHLTLPTNSRV